ncbi:hypothetical protein [Paraburkholderia bannensis]|uniref:hypothetical protein n=1 Tax=Paraburkholderia bannensis TaxID=765414 RepID=UPI002AAF2410|nr:hypothetical protein [Paraburkholderia bannensis]
MAGKFFAKSGVVSGILLVLFIFSSFVDCSSANTKNIDSERLSKNTSLLSNRCGYVLDKNIIDKISKSYSKVNDRIISIDFYVSLKVADRPVNGKLSFGCFMVGAKESEASGLKRPTAAEEISQADSGGRYARNVVWQRTYEGAGWTGTIAYVNSVFGDQENLKVPDYFLVCPNKGKLACFSFEVQRPRLDRRESDKIPDLLRGIVFLK